jgi:type II secretory pathway pseudopilin PulG
MSLFELVMVLAIIAVVGAIAAPRYANAVANHRSAAAAHRIVADLELARRKARATRQSQSVIFDLVGDRVRIPGVGHLNDPSAEYVTQLTEDPYRAELVSADLGGDAEIIFDGYGVPDSGGTIVVQHSGVKQTIVLSAGSGKAEVQ